MANKNASLHFDHKEIGVIFSLFVFVALLMFTVGILVGKGLTLSKYEGKVAVDVKHFEDKLAQSGGSSKGNGTIVSTNRPRVERTPTRSAETLELLPKEGAKSPELGDSLLEPEDRTSTYSDLLKKRSINELLEDDGTNFKTGASKKNRITASVPASGAIPGSYADGKFTVQVASYPDQLTAEERVGKLKQMGFNHAYFSAKKIPGKNTTWFRVWLGFYPDFQTAKANADYLTQAGEVRNYLVRKINEVDK